MPRHWLQPVHFSPLATKPSLPALLKRTWPLQSNHVQPHYFIERFVIFPPIPPFFDLQVEGISRQNQSILGRENAGGRIRRRRKGVEKGGESRFNNTQPCDDGGGGGNCTIMMTILTFIFVVGPGVRCCGCCVCGLQGCSRCVGGSCSRCQLPHFTRHTSHVTRHVPAEADGDAQAHGGGGGSAAAPVHRKTRI
jgi:hypothetical protein